eukprot:GHVN01024794.1.p1 GENE.GHVN01024794.1~~GHVN01024794.1.p1  ORF type:complete len:491 (+),score=168.24 GHVN01024794.1:667-2139(+)
MREAITINKSMLTLGKVVSMLSENRDKSEGREKGEKGGKCESDESERKAKSKSGGRQTHIPYRDSLLTRILQPALTSSTHHNALTVFILCISPHTDSLRESLHTLRFGDRASAIKRRVTSNRQPVWGDPRGKGEKGEVDRLKKDLSKAMLRIDTLLTHTQQQQQLLDILASKLTGDKKAISTPTSQPRSNHLINSTPPPSHPPSLSDLIQPPKGMLADSVQAYRSTQPKTTPIPDPLRTESLTQPKLIGTQSSASRTSARYPPLPQCPTPQPIPTTGYTSKAPTSLNRPSQPSITSLKSLPHPRETALSVSIKVISPPNTPPPSPHSPHLTPTSLTRRNYTDSHTSIRRESIDGKTPTRSPQSSHSACSPYSPHSPFSPHSPDSPHLPSTPQSIPSPFSDSSDSLSDILGCTDVSEASEVNGINTASEESEVCEGSLVEVRGVSEFDEVSESDESEISRVGETSDNMSEVSDESEASEVSDSDLSDILTV